MRLYSPVKRMDERTVIKIFQDAFGGGGFVPEDVESFELEGTGIVFNIDTLVESTDLPRGLGLEGAARKSVIASASDFAAKGVRPKFGFVSIVIPERYAKKEISCLARGLAGSARDLGFRILGGDTNVGRELSLSICLIGNAESIVGRGGAETDDLIFVTGPFGYAAAGLEIIMNGRRAGGALLQKAERAVFLPECKMEFGVAARSTMTSAMDSSDGLSTALNEMARQSGKEFVIREIPAERDLLEFAVENGIEPVSLIFDGGEEFEIVFTARPAEKEAIMNTAARLGTSIIEIGRVVEGSGVVFKSDEDSFMIKDRGWDHFKKRFENL